MNPQLGSGWSTAEKLRKETAMDSVFMEEAMYAWGIVSV